MSSQEARELIDHVIIKRRIEERQINQLRCPIIV